ncbi:lysophospholipid acyltransferase family protein [Tamlana sp. 2_MG-2023]|uniref:lysophospholipid acyltransferase family protein n=1 Tax=unclassified Tamlana TaxID=2614803 RepID=UPI0026E43BC3|nr:MULTISPECIES: lysophospholipid acyltransferase family protein [unclassified Tamlana]MDO6759840.1 lysophospholipid acyltransferase family protein [Tamlana sp. 2_MG-2023]MDO6791463.1 lysophospholipid acyltransferase family protein [Tamlana sp. 1_MG-2023]
MQKILSYPISVIYVIVFFLTLCVFHVLQWLSFNIFGYNVHKKVVDGLQFSLICCARLLGTRFTFTNPYDIDTNQPLIIVSNHQSLHDIYPITWYMRKHHPKFISKIELGHGIPSVSYNLRHGGGALIDRKNPRQSLPALMKFGEYIENTKRAAVIFPEGTRSKNGVPKPFQTRGLEILFKKIPSAVVVPITINNSWKMLKYGNFPMGLGTHITFTVHKPLKVSTFVNKQDLLDSIETTITNSIEP